MTLNHWLAASRMLGIAAAVALVLSVLALQDIFHGEADVRTEWWAVRVSAATTALFIATALTTLSKVRKII